MPQDLPPFPCFRPCRAPAPTNTLENASNIIPGWEKRWGWRLMGWERLVKLWQLQGFVCQQSLMLIFSLVLGEMVVLGKLPVLGWECPWICAPGTGMWHLPPWARGCLSHTEMEKLIPWNRCLWIPSALAWPLFISLISKILLCWRCPWNSPKHRENWE